MNTTTETKRGSKINGYATKGRALAAARRAGVRFGVLYTVEREGLIVWYFERDARHETIARALRGERVEIMQADPCWGVPASHIVSAETFEASK